MRANNKMFQLLVLKTSLPVKHATRMCKVKVETLQICFVTLKISIPFLYNKVMKRSKRTCSGMAKAATVNTITSCIDKTSYYDQTSKQAKEMNKAIAYFLAKDMQPYHTVEHQGLSMVSNLNPKYNLPSCKHFHEKEIPSLYALVKSDISSKLEKMVFYSTTTDLWTSRATHPYLSYTIHLVNENWDLQSFCLETNHTGDNVVASIKDIMTNWNLTAEQLVSTTTDNGSNFVAGFHNHRWVQLSCFGHCLDLAISK